MTTLSAPTLTLDFRQFIPEPPSIITEEAWLRRDALATKYYPQIMDLMEFGEDHLVGILMDVEMNDAPSREFAVGPPGGRPLAWLPRRSWLEWHLFRGVAPAARRPTISPSLRAAVIARDGNVCGICSGPVEDNDIHLDHVKPFSKGGETSLANLRVTHSRCNMRKGARY